MSDPASNRVSFIIPVYNEKESLRFLHAGIREAMGKLGRPCEIIFVDDGSRDGSDRVLDELFASDPDVQVIHLRRNFGKAAALAAGFAQARGEILFTLDADLQDDPVEIPKFLARIEEGYDLVSGWKSPRRDPLTRRLASWVYNRVAGRLAGVKLHDMNCGFKAYRREATEYLNLYGEMHRYIPVIASSFGFRIGEVKITHHRRRFGKSKYGLWRFFSGFFDLFTVLILTRWAARPQHVFGMFGLLLTLAGAGITLALLVWRLMGNFLSNRPLFYLGLSVLIVGIQVVFFGFLAEMIAHSRSADTFYSIREHRRHAPPASPPEEGAR
ncbi:MAG: glycosyltransferase family 2 protein [Acidobacteria bacterium]|nr:glycosyltransferase family 2 protein [Acidobacteriota bacterium]